jgi:hypothetical protein
MKKSLERENRSVISSLFEYHNLKLRERDAPTPILSRDFRSAGILPASLFPFSSPLAETGLDITKSVT